MNASIPTQKAIVYEILSMLLGIAVVVVIVFFIVGITIYVSYVFDPPEELGPIGLWPIAGVFLGVVLGVLSAIWSCAVRAVAWKLHWSPKVELIVGTLTYLTGAVVFAATSEGVIRSPSDIAMLMLYFLVIPSAYVVFWLVHRRFRCEMRVCPSGRASQRWHEKL